jgi:hypothetical protein
LKASFSELRSITGFPTLYLSKGRKKERKREKMSTQDAPQQLDLKQKASKYAGVFAAMACLSNLGLGGFLLWTWITSREQCPATPRIALWTLVSAVTSVTIGSFFAIYAIVAGILSIRRLDYRQLENDSSPDLLSASRPNRFFTLSVIFLALIYLFRLAWLIFGTVEVFSSTCDKSLQHMGSVYIIIQWALLAATVFFACAFCWILLCCAALLAKG